MADVINRTTFQYLRSVNTPDYPVRDWIINPTADEIRSAALAREAAKPPRVQSDDERLKEVESRLTALENVR